MSKDFFGNTKRVINAFVLLDSVRERDHYFNRRTKY